MKQNVSQENIYFALYMAFNDDSCLHCEESFFSYGYHMASQNTIKDGNISFIKQIMEHGHTAEEIVEKVPCAENLVKEVCAITEKI